jgi:hypothetical protein
MELEGMSLRCLSELEVCCSQSAEHQLQLLGNLSWMLKKSKRKKEASPEECDQAVEGLSTAKAKAKAKQVQESLKSSQSIVKKFWARILGIGPALRAVASMSRYMFFP